MEKLNDIERKQMKNRILTEGLKPQKRNHFKRSLIATAAALIIAVPIFGFSFPAMAQHIPFIGIIFARDENSNFTVAEEDAVQMGHTLEKNGFSTTLEEVFIDGSYVYLTFQIESIDGAILVTDNERQTQELSEGYVSFDNALDMTINGLPLNFGYGWQVIISEDGKSKTLIFDVSADEMSEGDRVFVRLLSVDGFSEDRLSEPWVFEFIAPAFND